MYDVMKMKRIIEEAVSKAENEVKEIFIDAFKKIYKGDEIPTEFDEALKISIIKLKAKKDTEKIFAGPGFYVIMTDLDIGKNICKLVKNNSARAIYRGECSQVKKRIQSHLFNSSYKEEYEKRRKAYLEKEENGTKEYYEQFWPACIKLGDGTNGIDIDKDYKSNNWYVVVHKMAGSSQQVRVQAEIAFDSVFNKPAASRENT